jgi:hypothetical protein
MDFERIWRRSFKYELPNMSRMPKCTTQILIEYSRPGPLDHKILTFQNNQMYHEMTHIILSGLEVLL